MGTSLESATITQYIDTIHNDSVRMETLYLQEATRNDDTLFIVNDRSLLCNYWKELVDSSILYTFDSHQKLKYYYRPWLFCHDRYGNREIWFELLKLNQLSSFTEFDFETIRIFNPNILRKIKMIIDAEKEVIDLNEDTILRAKKEAAI